MTDIKGITAALALAGTLLATGAAPVDVGETGHLNATAHWNAFETAPTVAPEPALEDHEARTDGSALDDNAIIQEYCVRCHSDRRLRGNLSLETFDAEQPDLSAEVAEKMVVKLRAGMMPPPGVSRPEGDTLDVLVAALERRLDQAAERRPNPGSRTFQRLNQAEYAASVHDLLGLSEHSARFVQNFMQGRDSIQAALRAFVEAVKAGEYPREEHGYQ